MKIEHFIQGDKFKGLAKWFYVPEKRSRDDYDGIENTLDWVLLKNNDIVYTHTHYVKQLFEELKKTPKYIILISHNSDVNVDRTFDIPWNIVKWYTQNVNIKHNRVISIPIGIENDRWMKKVDKKRLMTLQLHSEMKKIRNLVYMNHNISTNPIERMHVYQLLEGKPWVTSVRGKNGSNFSEYINNVYHHSFVVCPNGNGIDTHRVWETLEMHSFPIMKRDLNNQFYSELPICFVDDWEDITEKFLKSWYNEFLLRSFSDYSMLSFSYWENLIKSK